jgi:hypothetical protein
VIQNAEVGREDIFKLTTGNQSSQVISNYNGVRVVNFATFENLVVKSTMCPHPSIHKHTWTSPDGKTHETDHVLIDRRRHLSILHVRCFRGADIDNDHYLVVAKIRDRLAVSKRPVNKMDKDRFNLKKYKRGNLRNSIKLQSKTNFQLWRT